LNSLFYMEINKYIYIYISEPTTNQNACLKLEFR